MSTSAVPRIGERASWQRVVIDWLETAGYVTRSRGDDHAEFRCPAHEDHRASGTADYRAGDPGRTLLHCHGGCSAEDIMAAGPLTMADLFDGPAPRDARPAPPRPRRAPERPRPAPAAPTCRHHYAPDPDYPEHPYVTADGVLLARVLRKRCDRPGCGQKRIQPDRAGWAEADRVLYRLPDVLAAVEAGRVVYVVEGEKSADVLAALGHAATTNPFGAGKWLAQHTAALAGAARVVVIADNDRDGYAHAAHVAGQLAAAGVPDVTTVRAAADIPKVDVVDHLAAGGTVETLLPVDPRARLAEPEPGDDHGAQVADLTARRGGGGRPPRGGDSGGPERDPGQRPSGHVPVSGRAGDWGYALDREDFPGFEGRGVYELHGGTWRRRAPLPYVHLRIIRRDGTGHQVGTEFLVSVAVDGPRRIMGHLGIRDGSWANELGLPLADDPKVIQAAGTALRELAHSDAVPEREAVPRVGPDGRVGVPVPECLPTGYLICAEGTRAAGLGVWADTAAVVARTPKLAAVLGASVFSVFMRAMRRQSYWLELFGEPGQGKTTALTLAAGVWGAVIGDDQEVLLAWNETGIGMSRFLGRLGILPAFFDEQGMAHFTPGDWGELIFKTTQGNQRGTADRKSIQGTNRSLPWGGVLFTSGNGRVTAGLGAGKYAGLLRRVISIPSPFTSSAAEAEALVGTEDSPGLIERCYGHLGAEILARFGIEDARGVLAGCAPLVGELPEEAVARTLAKHLHAAVAGAAMADEVLGTGTALRDAAAAFYREYLAEHGVTPEHDADRVVSAVREAMAREPSRWPTRAEYAEHLKPRPETELGAREPGRAELPQRGMARDFAGVRADDGTWVAVFPEPFHDELAAKHGIDETLALAELFRRGVLQVAPSLRARGEWLTPVRLEPKPAGPVPMYKLALPEPDDEESEVTGSGDTAPIKRITSGSPQTPQTPQVSADEAPQTPPQTPPQTHPKPTAAPEHSPGHVTTAERFAAPALVADVDGGYLARPDRLEAVPLPEPLRDLADAVGWARTLRLGIERPSGRHDDAVLVVLPELAARLGLPADPPERGSKAAREHAALGPLRGSGWNVTELCSAMRVWRQGGRTVRVWLPGWDDYGKCPMWGENGVPAVTLAYRLGLFAEHLGIGWWMTGGATGVDLAGTFPRRLHLVAAEPPKPARMAAVEPDYTWSRKPMSDEAAAGWLHCYDANAMYLPAYGQVRVNLGGWRHVDAPAFDPREPGYWLHDPGVWDDRLLPDPLDPTGRAAAGVPARGPRWYATPTLAGLAELGYEIRPREALLPAEGADRGRWYEPLYKRLRDARAALTAARPDDDAGAVLGAVKSVWHETHGMFCVASQREQYRPDHRHAIIAYARTGMLRRLAQIADAEQRWPLAIATDNVAFASTDPDPVTACPAGLALGTGLGEFKVAGSLPMAQALPLLGTGRLADLTDPERGLFGLAAEHGGKE